MFRPNRPVLTEKQQKWLVAHYKHTKNAEICERLGISIYFLHAFAKELGLKKSKQFMNRTAADGSKAARIVNERNGWPPKGYRPPNTHSFPKGVSNLQRFGAKKEAERKAKAAESLRQTRRLEHARWIFGEPRRTKLRVAKQPKKKVQQRYRLKKLGYIVDDAAHMAYWTEDTHRASVLEKTGSIYYKFAPYRDIQQNS